MQPSHDSSIERGRPRPTLRGHRKLATLLASALLPALSSADTLIVPTQYPTIQSAIDAAQDHDTVQVLAGTYSETLTWVGKPLNLRGAAGSANCILSGDGFQSILTVSDVPAGSHLSGFTLREGGVGLRANDASLTVSDCIFTANRSRGATLLDSNGMRFFDCAFIDNMSLSNPGLRISYSEVRFERVAIEDHHRRSLESELPAMHECIYAYRADLEFIDCTLSGNRSQLGSTLLALESDLRMEACRIEGNEKVGSGAGATILVAGPTSSAQVMGSAWSANEPGPGGSVLQIQFSSAEQRIERNRFLDNRGTAIDLQYNFGLVEGNLIAGQTDCDAGLRIGTAHPGAILEVRGNTVAANACDLASGLHVGELNGNLILENNIFSGDASRTLMRADVPAAGPIESNLRYNAFHPVSDLHWLQFPDVIGVHGNLAQDPAFRNAAQGDYRLAAGSPCIEAGKPYATDLGLDPLNYPRLIDGDLDGEMRIDIGALEFNNAELSMTGEASPGTTVHLRLDGPAGRTGFIVYSRTGAGAFRAPFGMFYPLLNELSHPDYGILAAGPMPLSTSHTFADEWYAPTVLQGVLRDTASHGGNVSNVIFLEP